LKRAEAVEKRGAIGFVEECFHSLIVTVGREPARSNHT
jgi:hypothetical protein